MEEIWKPITGWPAYEVSNHGRVRSIDRYVNGKNGCKSRRSGKVLKNQIDRYGYPYIKLPLSGRLKHESIHRLVAKEFLPPSDLPEVNHIDLDKTNNYYRNLEWCTRAGNLEHAAANGKPFGGPRKINMQIAEQIRADRRNGMMFKNIAKKYDIDIAHAFRISKGMRWAA